MKFNFKKCIALNIAAVALAIGAAPLQAANNYYMEYNKTISKIGAQGDGFYVQFAESFGQNCIYGTGYFSSKGIYAQILTASLMGQKLSRVDYTQPGGAGTECYISLVEFANQ